MDGMYGILYGAQPAGFNCGGKDFLDIGFDDWRLAIVYQVNFYSGPINPDDFMPIMGEACRGHGADIT
jgi:hypothetical protein